MTIDDEELLALLDGRLDAATAAELRRQLANDLRATTRLRDMSRSGDYLARVDAPSNSGLDALTKGIRSGQLDGNDAEVAAEPGRVVPLQPRPTTRDTMPSKTASNRQQRWSTSARIAAGIALMTLGFLAGYWGSLSASSPQQSAETSMPTWVLRVVDYHTLYGRETVASAAITTDQKDELKIRFEDALNTQMHIPELYGRKLEFRRGQLLRFKDTPIIQLAYLPDETGAPVALCLRTTKEKDSAPVFTVFHGMGVVRWRQRGLDYVLVGHRNKADLMADARKAVAEIKASGTI